MFANSSRRRFLQLLGASTGAALFETSQRPASLLASQSPTIGTPDLDAAEELASGLQIPWGLAFLPDGSAVVGERNTGRVLQIDASGGEPTQVYLVPDVAQIFEGGLLGLALSPAYAQDSSIYAYVTTAEDSRIIRFQPGSDTPPEVILEGIDRGEIHSGGRIAFGPDGMLYAAVGEGGIRERAQDLESLGGKILRLTPEGEPAPGNPFPDSYVYSFGHRNIEGLAWDAQGKLFASEFGENAFDELNLIEPGRNYGWPIVEGIGDTQNGELTNPLRVWPVSEASPAGIAIAGDTIYMAALRGQRLWTIPIEGETLGEPTAYLHEVYGRLRTVAFAPDGSLWLTTSNTDILGQPREGDDRILRFALR